MSIMEQSHRAAPYDEVHSGALSLVRELLSVPDTHDVLFMGAGASQQFALVPLNLLAAEQSADYIVTGVWGKKALAEARQVGSARAAFDGAEENEFRAIPAQGQLSLDRAAAYVHLTSNNTVVGTQWHHFPDVSGVPLVADMSSDIFGRTIRVSDFGLIYAGAQKNLGPSGVTLVIVRKDLLQRTPRPLPQILRYSTHAESGSLYNTPPTFAIYLVRGVLQHLKEGGGVAEAERRNRAKAKLLYDAIESRPDLFECPVDPASRSMMNIVFRLPTVELEARFVREASEAGFAGIKGHRIVGGIRVSSYNAAPLTWVERFVSFMSSFSP